MRLSEFAKKVEGLWPLEYAEKWDNCGLQIGDPSMEVREVSVCLDVHENIIEDLPKNCNVLFTHHPLFFKGFKSIDLSTWHGKIISALIEKRIAVYTAHTNLDNAPHGLNAILADKIYALYPGQFYDPSYPNRKILRINTDGFDLIDNVKKILDLKTLNFAGDLGKEIKRIFICTGAGGSYLDEAIKLGCDAIVTGDLTYHTFQDAERAGMVAIDFGHYASENKLLEDILDPLNEIVTTTINGWNIRPDQMHRGER